MTIKSTFLICLLVLTGIAFAGSLPASLFFVANEGQWEEPFAFKANVGSAIYYVTPSGMTMDYRQYERSQRARDPMDRFELRHEPEPMNVRGHVLKMDFANANLHPEIIGEDKLSSYSNYFIGRDSCKWRSFVGHYQIVRVKSVWNGIDVEYRIQAEGIETAYRVQAGADASQIMVQYEGLDAPLQTDGQGNLLLQTSLGTIKEKAPFAYQIIDHRQVEVPVRFQVLADDKYSLSFEAFDAEQELVIDPLVYCSFLGGILNEYAEDAVVDSRGRKFVVGRTESSNFPVTIGAYQTSRSNSGSDGFVTCFHATADSVLFSTFLGGSAPPTPTDNYIYCVAVTPQGAIYVGGSTLSYNFPLTPDAFDTVRQGIYDGVFARLSGDGSHLEFSTYVGGEYSDVVVNMDLDSLGIVYLSGVASAGFQVTPNALFLNPNGLAPAFLATFDPNISRLQYATYIPGNFTTSSYALRVVSSASIWLGGIAQDSLLPTTPNAVQPNYRGGEDGFISLWDLQANRLVYCSYMGGTGNDIVYGLAPINQHAVVMTGKTSSLNFPVTSGAFDTTFAGNGASYFGDAFVTVLDTAQGILSSTYLGGEADEWGRAVGVDSTGVVVVGSTTSGNFPITRDAYDSLLNQNGGSSDIYYDAFLAKLDANLSHLEYSTYLGGHWNDQARGAAFVGEDTVWIVGETGSDDFPITPAAFQTQYHGGGDAFLLGFAIPESASAISPRENELPEDLSLNIYPNPFNPSTTISFSLPKISPVQLNVFDILGRAVYRADLGRMNAGIHQQLFNLPGLASGTYVVRLNAGTTTLSRKMVMLK